MRITKPTGVTGYIDKRDLDWLYGIFGEGLEEPLSEETVSVREGFFEEPLSGAWTLAPTTDAQWETWREDADREAHICEEVWKRAESLSARAPHKPVAPVAPRVPDLDASIREVSHELKPSPRLHAVGMELMELRNAWWAFDRMEASEEILTQCRRNYNAGLAKRELLRKADATRRKVMARAQGRTRYREELADFPGKHAEWLQEMKRYRTRLKRYEQAMLAHQERVSLEHARLREQVIAELDSDRS